MEWYVKKEDDAVFGPISLSELKDWAAEGRIAPEDSISTDKKSWQASHENRDLHMDWMIELDDGSSYGPIHLLAFSDFLIDGSVDMQTTITNMRHDVSYQLGEVLLPATIKTNNSLRNAISLLAHQKEEEIAALESKQRAELEKRAADTPPASQPPPADTQPAPVSEDQGTVKGIADEKKKAAHWERLYKDETAKSEKREKDLREQLREMQQEQLALTTELDHIKSELKRQEKKNEEFDKFSSLAEQPGENQVAALKMQYKSLLDSYNDLSMQYDRLSAQITGQSEELEELRGAKATIQKNADKKIKDMSEELEREREEADKAKAKLSESEKNYTDLLKSYREMNDKLVRLRQEF